MLTTEHGNWSIYPLTRSSVLRGVPESTESRVQLGPPKQAEQAHVTGKKPSRRDAGVKVAPVSALRALGSTL